MRGHLHPRQSHRCRTAPRTGLGLRLLLQPSDIAGIMLQAALGSFPQDDTASAVITVSDASDELLDAAVRLLRLLDPPRDSPSQFSREYRRPFGAPPSQDAVRLTAHTADEED
ncbi:AraC family transcriptional regulator N-terminal domain-containing protein [Streptomyces sp. NPDC005209]|uniref:AraC family transcriptional regulator N-terminal domain-containing protein n=1 Tax=Streptomyces sp. NPDC005209 TaxID=3156715 RepID=UPI0033A3A7A5